MRDVVVIGGGLSGLAACCALEKQGARCTVIEVKPRFGGSIASTSERGFVIDASAFALQTPSSAALTELGLQTIDLGAGTQGFAQGTESIIRAFADRLTGGRLMRMAVSSIGRWQGRFAICLENGMLLDARAVIVAAPARFAQRMLHNLAPPVAAALRAYHYDSIYRVSLGYHQSQLPQKTRAAYGMRFPFLLRTNHPTRVPSPEHALLQVAVRAPAGCEAAAVVQAAVQYYGWQGPPLVQRVDYWGEADPLDCYDADHRQKMRALQHQLPPGIWLIGSDYGSPPQRMGVARLDERIRQGQSAAQAALRHLSAGRA